MSSAPLNVFQRIVRQWDRIHPYNAAQVMRVAGRPDLPRIERAFAQALAALGLGNPRFVGRRYDFAPAPAVSVPELDATRPLCDHLTDRINRPFADGALPLDPFVLAQPDGLCLGIVYQHWIADSVAMRLLMRQWFLRLFDPDRADNRPVDLPTGGYWRTFGPAQTRWSLPDGLLAGPRWFSRFRRVRKVHTAGSRDYRMRVAIHRAPAGLIDAVRDFARRRGTTVNDVFLAAGAQACALHLPMRQRRSRQDLALGTIVDLRATSHRDLSNTFGLFLGFANVICRPGHLRDFDRLLSAITAQTQNAKSEHHAAAGMVWLCAALWAGRLLKPDNTFSFYRKHMPLAAGISNVTLNDTWTADYHPSPLREYIRVSPTGPNVPLVFTPTTLGHDLHLALTHRQSVIGPDCADAVAASFLSRLQSL